MKAVFTAAALNDLEDIFAYTKQKFPRSEEPLKHRIRAVISSIEQWPESGRLIPNRAGVRTVPLIRYPFRVFYEIVDAEIRILHIHHAARDD